MRRMICGLLTVFVLFLGLPGIDGTGLFDASAETPHIVQIAAGNAHSLALFSDGSLYAWGNNGNGQLGDGTTENRSSPILIGTGYTAIAAGGWHSLALKGSSLYAWGANESTRPACIGTGYTAIAAGGWHSLALKGSELYAWGVTEDPAHLDTGYTAIAAGFRHSLLLKGSALYAWGENEYGQLGDGTTTRRDLPVLIGTGYTSIPTGGLHSLALKGGALYAWGLNSDGQLGDGTTTNRSTPTPIGTGYTAAAAGLHHSLALKGSALYAWGDNQFGQLGDGTTVQKNTPIMIGTGYTAIAACGEHSLALKGGVLYAWGENGGGQLGDGTTTNRNAPTRVTFPALAAPEPLYISRFIVKNTNLAIGDKAVITAETGANATQVRLYKDGTPIATAQSYKKVNGKRVWVFTPVMTASGQFRYWAIASNGTGSGAESADIVVNVSTKSLEVKDISINGPALDVSEMITFVVTTGKLASKVNILDASNQAFASSSKPSKITSTQKIWKIQRRLTENDMGSYVLHAVVDSIYGTFPDNKTLELRVTDNLPRIISVQPVVATTKRNVELQFVVNTNQATTCVWISNDKKERWFKVVWENPSPPETNRRVWWVTTVPNQLGIRKFYAQAYRGALPGPKVLVRKIRVIK